MERGINKETFPAEGPSITFQVPNRFLVQDSLSPQEPGTVCFSKFEDVHHAAGEYIRQLKFHGRTRDGAPTSPNAWYSAVSRVTIVG